MRHKRNLACPDCQRPLDPRRAGSVTVHVCVSCAGLFLPAGMLEAARADAAVRARVLEPELVPDPEAPARAPVANHRRCPECRAPMDTTRRGGHPPLRFESCRRDGVFLDRGELTLLVERLENDKALGAAAVATAMAASASQPQAQRSVLDHLSVAGDVVEGVVEVGGAVLDVGEVIAAIFS